METTQKTVTSDDYWKVAHAAITEGVITHDQALTICRFGHRKSGNWARHLLDLENIIKWKKEALKDVQDDIEETGRDIHAVRSGTRDEPDGDETEN